MTPERRESIVRELPIQAQKVFESVPGSAAWTAQHIASDLYATTRSGMELRTVKGCLDRLVDAGIVKEAPRGHFQRAKVSMPRMEQDADPAHPAEPEVSAADHPPAVEPIDLLSGIAGRLSRISDDIRAITSDLETAALRIEEQRECNERGVKKLRQLQTLLKEL
ncbi:hypothetical protein [Paraburkholderia terricola]|jgi:hypothetical protein|uniref:hypothetical protein n=1 Tax=Paraburkholderia terricola TaxID=169427 RepID=UPI003ED0A913